MPETVANAPVAAPDAPKKQDSPKPLASFTVYGSEAICKGVSGYSYRLVIKEQPIGFCAVEHERISGQGLYDCERACPARLSHDHCYHTRDLEAILNHRIVQAFRVASCKPLAGIHAEMQEARCGVCGNKVAKVTMTLKAIWAGGGEFDKNPILLCLGGKHHLPAKRESGARL